MPLITKEKANQLLENRKEKEERVWIMILSTKL
jgi:hypothetical protein